MVFGIRTPVQGRGPAAGTSRPQESPSPDHMGNEGPSGAREAPRGLSLKFGRKDAAQGTLAETAETPLSSSAVASGAVARATTPSPAGPPGQAQDAARTFIRRPERKRRSIDVMEAYKRQTNTYAELTNDRLLQEVMKTFEDIPSRVKEYPQMRRDIKSFLETQSDKSLRILFELSGRVKALETAPKKVPTNSTTPETPQEILERLEKVEANINTRLNELEEKMSEGFKNTAYLYDEGGADVVDKVIDRIEEVSEKVKTVQAGINHTIEGVKIVGHAAAALEDQVGGVVGGVAASIESSIESIKEVIREACGQKATPHSYADVTAAKPGRRPALHSMAVTSEVSLETADEVLARVKEAVDARGTGLKINKVRKAKNQTVILGCDSENELRRVKDMIESRGKGLLVEPMRNKNPLVVLKDVFLDSDDDEVVKALYAQNEDIFRDLVQEEREMTIKYKKRTRNPKTSHVVVQVRPKVWQRMTEAGALYLDLQRVRVEDQSPLIQCTKCLAFGHGRKFCTEGADRCSHCGGPHLREKCLEHIAGNEPQCCNCSHSGLRKTDHNAFSVECPVRKKWDYLARTTTAYA